MGNFKIGDRCRVYTAFGMETCTISHISARGFLFFENKDVIKSAHPKQCRRLVKKPRRSVWLYERDLNSLFMAAREETFAVEGFIFKGKDKDTNQVEFIEVRKKK